MSTTTPERRRDRRRGRGNPTDRATRRQPTRSSAVSPRTARSRTIRRDPGLDVPQPADQRQDAVLSLLSIAVGPVLLICGAAILDVPVGSLLSSAAPSVVQEHLPRLDSGLREAEHVVGLGAAGLGLLLSAAALLGAVASTILVILARLGRLDAGPARNILERLSPGFMRRTVVLTLAAQLAVTGAGAVTTLHHHSTPSGTGGSSSISSISTDDRAVEETRSAASGPADLLLPLSAAEDPPDETAQSATPGPGPVEEHPPAAEEDPMSPLFTPDPPAPEADRHQGAETRERSDAEVTVRAGDSLWDIAAEQLGPQATDWEIAELWPQWYEANREAIGGDPGHLLPGTVLTPPEHDPSA